MKKQYLLNIKADDRPGLLHLVTGIINRRLIAIESLTAAKTDIHDIVMITIELFISEKALTPLLLKLDNIIEVFAVEARPAENVLTLRSAFFRMGKAFLETPAVASLVQHNARIVNIYPDAVLVGKCGTDAEVRSLYAVLDGPYLQGFSQSGLIADSKLIIQNDDWRIIGLAA
jgi:acetolactate synthase small subunit